MVADTQTCCTADELCGRTDIDDLERPSTITIGVVSDFFSDFRLQYAL